MCAPVGDGAAAAIVCSERYLKSRRTDLSNLASVLGTRATGLMIRTSANPVETATKAGWAGGDRPGRLHDATSWGNPPDGSDGLLPDGQADPTRRATAWWGRPINTSGGLECKDHHIGASDFHKFEIVTQLRGTRASAPEEGRDRHDRKRRLASASRSRCAFIFWRSKNDQKMKA